MQKVNQELHKETLEMMNNFIIFTVVVVLWANVSKHIKLYTSCDLLSVNYTSTKVFLKKMEIINEK